MLGVEPLLPSSSAMFQDCEPAKPQRSQHPSSSSHNSFIRQLVRSMSLEDLADDEVCDILSDSPDSEEDESSLIGLSKHIDSTRSINLKKPFNYHVFPNDPASCYTVDMHTGVASPIKITSNIEVGFPKGKKIVRVSFSLSSFLFPLPLLPLFFVHIIYAFIAE